MELSVNRSHRKLLIISLLLLSAVLLSGCGGITVVDNQTVYKPGIFEFLAAPLRATVVFFHDSILQPAGIAYAWGWSIILVALVIRLLLLPLGLKQMRSMREASAKMKILQPELDRIKKKYGNDKKKLQQEQMKLYQEHGITQAQMAGCLPTLLQMPILFAFYYAILGLASDSGLDVSGRLLNQRFYFIPDISQPHYRDGMSWLTANFSLGKLQDPNIWPYLVLPVLLAITQYVMLKTGQQNQPQSDSSDSPAAGMMGQMSWLMTGMFVFFALQVPAGLSLYWVVGNFLALAQQLYVNQQKEHWEEEIQAKSKSILTASRQAAQQEETAALSQETVPASKAKTSTSGARRKRRRRR